MTKSGENKKKDKEEQAKISDKDMQSWMGLKIKLTEAQNAVNKSVFEISKFIRKVARKKFFRHRGEYGLTDNGVLVPPNVMNKIRELQKDNRTDDEEYDDYIDKIEKKYSKFKLDDKEMEEYWSFVRVNEDASDAMTEVMLDRGDLLSDLVKKYKYTGDFPVDIDKNGVIIKGTPVTR